MDTLLVFTSRNREQLLADGGSRDWVLDAPRARKCRYLVCTWNAYGEHSSDRGLQHHEAFLIGTISSVEPSPHDPGRYIIRFDSFANVDIPNVWPGLRNPVNYTSMKDLGIDLDNVTFQPVNLAGAPGSLPSAPASTPNGLSIAEAKRALATYYEVAPTAIEITIRG